MKTTNNTGLPQAFVNFVSNVRHNPAGTLSATTLLKGDKEIVLYDRHFEELEQDAADLVWASFGTAFHAIMEKQDTEAFKEEAFEVEVEGWKVTGRVDFYDMKNEILGDYKTASVWKVIYGDFADWKDQGLTYAWLMKQHGLNVKRCEFYAFLKDHSKTEAKRKPDYPQMPVYKYAFDVTEADLEETEARIKAKIRSVTEAYKLGDDDIAPCSAEERWETATKYAVMKDGRKTAVKVCETREEADSFINAQTNTAGLYVQERKGESKKCAEYCPCCEFCNFYKQNVKQPDDEQQSA
ncbi:MAG: hypothetical protein IIZ93_08960 [Acidaminococcaceae bacterium]|nr:hypothetical protein [Acidaminococcaceae bacterium]